MTYFGALRVVDAGDVVKLLETKYLPVGTRSGVEGGTICRRVVLPTMPPNWHGRQTREYYLW